MQDKKMVEVYKKTIVDRLYSETMRQFVFVFFLASAFTYGFMYRIIDCRTAIWVIIPLVLYLIFDPRNTKSPFDYSLLILSAIYFLIGVFQYFSNPYLNYIYDPTVYAWTAPLVYLLGKMIAVAPKRKLENHGFVILFVLGIGMFAQAILDYVPHFVWEYKMGYEHVVQYNSFWGEVLANRNLFDYGFMIILAVFPYAFIVRKKRKWLLPVAIVISVVSIAISMLDWGRTIIASLFLVTLVIFVIYSANNSKNLSKRFKKNTVYGLVALVVLGLLVYAMAMTNFLGFDDLTNLKFMLTRDGGVLNNVRIKFIVEGLHNIFTIQKGGWNIDYGTTHCTWTEMGRNYDIIIFLLWLVFLIVTWIQALGAVVKYSKDYPIFYFSFGALFLLFFFCMLEENPFVYKDLLLFYVFICGLINGLVCIAKSGDYYLLHTQKTECKNRYLAYGMSLLIFALLSASYLEWWSDISKVFMTFILPTFLYAITFFINNIKSQLKCLTLFAILSTFIIVYMFVISRNSEYYPAGFYIEPFTNIVVEKSVFYGLWIIPISVVVGGVLHWFKVNKWIAAVVVTVVTGILSYGQITDGRLHMLKEAVKLQLNMEKNMRWMLSKENYEGIITSHNMYMDFARDYGVITFGLIIAFEIWAIICFIKMLMNSNKTMVEYVLIVAFVLFNYHFMFESTAFASRYIFAIAMFVYGMIENSVTRTDKEYEGKWNILIRR